MSRKSGPIRRPPQVTIASKIDKEQKREFMHEEGSPNSINLKEASPQGEVSSTIRQRWIPSDVRYRETNKQFNTSITNTNESQNKKVSAIKFDSDIDAFTTLHNKFPKDEEMDIPAGLPDNIKEAIRKDKERKRREKEERRNEISQENFRQYDPCYNTKDEDIEQLLFNIKTIV